MYHVGRVGTYIAQGVNTVSGPFHPFGGAVDIIVVEQEDGSFKSSPWYVKFGKFQGVLKRNEKKVVVAVNDGDASFHMYLDHKGEAYFLKDAQGDDAASVLSPTEAASSGDESSSHTLAFEYPKGEERARAEQGKEESEDDLELRFEGREASKQLIQQSVEERETATLALDEIGAVQGNLSSDPQNPGSLRGAEDIAKVPTETDPEVSTSNGALMLSLFNKFGGLEETRRPTPVSTIVARAALAALGSSSLPDDTRLKESKTESRNGMIIQGLLNQAVGLQASQSPGPATALLASLALASLRKAVSDPQPDDSRALRGLLNQAVGLQPSQSSGPAGALVASAALASLHKAISEPQSETSLSSPRCQRKEALQGAMDVENNREYPVQGSPCGESSGNVKEQAPAVRCISSPCAVESQQSYGQNSDDAMLLTTVSSLGSLSRPESDIDEPRGPLPVDPVSPSHIVQVSDLTRVLEVKEVKLLDEAMVVEVQEHEEKDISGSIVAGEGSAVSLDTSDTVESIVIDRKEMMQKVNGLQDRGGQDELSVVFESKDADRLEAVPEQDVRPEEAGEKEINVHVDKHLMENLNDVLLCGDVEGPNMKLTAEKNVTRDGEVAKIRSGSTGDVASPDVATAGKELTVLNPVNLADIGSPRLKAAIELEMAWRNVMEKAATTLKGQPYTSKKFHYSQPFENECPVTYENVQKKPDVLEEPEQSEKKSWGGWFWGGSSAPPAKPTAQQGILKERKSVHGEFSMVPGLLDLVKHDVRDHSGIVSHAEDQIKKHGSDGSDSKSEAPGKEPQSVTHEGAEGQGESVSDSNVQQKVPGGPPQRRRSLFGLLSRSNTNQSVLSSVSSLQGNDDLQPMLEGLRRETSLEKAESVVDLLEEKWVRGSDAPKGLMAIVRVPDATIVKEIQDGKVKVETFEGEITGVVLQQVGGEGSFLAIQDLDGDDNSHGSINGQKSSFSVSNSTGAETVIRQLVSEQETSSIAAQELDQVRVCDGMTKAEDVCDSQHNIEAATNWPGADHASASVVSDEGQGEFDSTSNTEVVLMCVDGRLISAPLLPVDDELSQDSPNQHEMVYDDGVFNRGPSAGPSQRAVCFSDDVPQERSGLSSDAHELLKNGQQQIQHRKGVVSSEHILQELSRYVPDHTIRGIRASPSEESNVLGELGALDSRAESQPKVGMPYFRDSHRLASDLALGEFGLHSEEGTGAEMSGHDRRHINAVDNNDFTEMRAMVFGKLEETGDKDGLDTDQRGPSDKDGLDLDQGGLERFYSSGDLTETEHSRERRGLKRNMSEYMDAVSGEDEHESAGSPYEYGLNQSRNASSPIEIPGALDRAWSFHALDNIHILRSVSESLPNVRNHMLDSGMSSPRVKLGRSLDSAPLPTFLPSDIREQAVSSASGVTTGPSVSTMFAGLEIDKEGASVAARTAEKVNGELRTIRMTTTLSNITDDGEKGPDIGLELSLCQHLLTERMGLEAAALAFAAEKVTLDDFRKSGSLIAANERLVVRVGGRYYPWVVAAPIVLGILAFGQVLVAPNEGAIPVEQTAVVSDGKAPTSALTSVSSGGWKLWPFGSRRPKTPEKGIAGALISRDALVVATEAVLKSSLTKEYLRMNGYYKRQRKVRTNSPSSQQLASLNLKEGSNKITFTFVTRMLGKQQVDARIYLWKWNTRIVISDVDGTITKSDVLGQFMPLVGKDWTQSGVAKLFSAIKKNGYELMFLSARAISQAYLTRQFLENIKQDGEVLPDGPVVISPDGLFPSLYREVIRRAPHEFKIACLQDIKSLFPPESKPFYAGFGNRDTDELSYLKVGISKGKIFIINPKGEVVVNNQVDTKSYTSLHKLVDGMFPAMTFTEQEDYNEWNFWKLPLPDIEGESSSQSLGSSISRRGGKSARHL